MSTEYQLPQLPLGGSQATLARWLKRPGDHVSPGDPLLVVVNDCLEVVLPAPGEGDLEALLVAEGAPVIAGAPVARIVQSPASDVLSEPPAARERLAGPPCRISPVARRIAAALNADISILSGSGPGGRILKSDVLAAIENPAESVVRSPLSVATGRELRTTDYGLRTTDHRRG